jgi:hypothetical protein
MRRFPDSGLNLPLSELICSLHRPTYWRIWSSGISYLTVLFHFVLSLPETLLTLLLV